MTEPTVSPTTPPPTGSAVPHGAGPPGGAGAADPSGGARVPGSTGEADAPDPPGRARGAGARGAAGGAVDPASGRGPDPAAPLRGRCTVVTGASRGIGRAVAERFAGAGASVVVAVARDRAALDALAEAHPAVVPVVADLADAEQVAGAWSAAVEACGRVDVLVNNAGMGWTRRSTRLDAAQLDRLYATNIRSVTLLSVAAAEHMAGSGGGSIIGVSSITSLVGAPFLSAYAGTKGAMDALTRSLAAEWGDRGVRVNAVAPGVIDTDLWASARDDASRAFVNRQISLGRWGSPEEVADPVLFLASDAAGYVTGQVLVVDGGMTTHLELVAR